MHLDYTYTFVLMCDRSNAVNFNTHTELGIDMSGMLCVFIGCVYSVLLAAGAGVRE